MQLRSYFVACLGIGSLFATGCGDDTGGAGAQTVIPAVKSRRGESCASRNDCVDGLSCVQNRCIENDYPVDPTAKECVLVECTSSAECCVGFTPDPNCDFYFEECNTFGDEFYCNQYDQFCGPCTAVCENEQCIFPGAGCTSDAQCTPYFCSAGSCVECRGNEDCTNGLLCVSGSCSPGCVKNEECPLFNSCQGGQCVETGCTSDRECILFTTRPDAICKDTVCTVNCESNAECGQLEACQDGKCTFIGCETDPECKTYLGATGTDYSAVCRDKAQ